jgi:hypothetical protein
MDRSKKRDQGTRFSQGTALQDRVPVLQSQGVVRVVGSAGKREPIPDEEINALKKVINNCCDYICYPFLKEGDQRSIAGC